MATGIKAHKQYLSDLKSEMNTLRQKFEGGTIEDYEKDRMDTLASEIKSREQELKGFI